MVSVRLMICVAVLLPLVQASLFTLLSSLPAFELKGVVDFFRPFNTLGNIACLLRFIVLGPDLTSPERAQVIFREDSKMILAQAGVYTGPDDINEYVGFTTANSPYLASQPKYLGFSLKMKGMEEGMCNMLTGIHYEFNMDPDTTERAATFEVVVLLKISMNLKKGYLALVEVFYTNDFLNYFFGDLLASQNTQDFICSDVLNGVCTGVLGATANCDTRLGSLDVVEPTSFAVDGNSLGCRALHAAFAFTNPTNHCPHVSLDSFADPKGRELCQDSADIDVVDLFSNDDIEYIRDYTTRRGLDADIGYRQE